MTMGASGRDMSICLFGLYGLLHVMFGVPATLSSRTMAMHVPHCVLRCKDAHMLEVSHLSTNYFSLMLSVDGSKPLDIILKCLA